MRTYPRSSAILRREGVQWPEALRPDAWAEYMAIRAAEDEHYNALARAGRQRLFNAAARGRARCTARKAARQQKVAAAFAADPHVNMSALGRTLGVSRHTIYSDRAALGIAPLP